MASYKEFREGLYDNYVKKNDLFAFQDWFADKFKADFNTFNIGNSNDSFPAIGTLRYGNSYGDSLTVSSIQKKGSSYIVDLRRDMDGTNSYLNAKRPQSSYSSRYTPEQAASIIKRHETESKNAVKVLKSKGANVKMKEDGNLEMKIPVKDVQVANTNAKVAAANQGKWGIKMTGQRGNSTILTGTSNVRGPWRSADEAAAHIEDAARDHEYNDEFKRPSFSVVKL